jgi:23S rRNA pseudouridine955/2504/2580 synthase
MVINETPSAFVLNKPPGLATQGGTKTYQHLDRLLDGLAGDGERPKLVHRLDKDTSGALLVARNARSAGHFSKAFAGRTAKKVYWALLVGVPDRDQGEIDAPLAKQPGTGGEKMHINEEYGLPAKTRWRVIDRAGNRAAWVELQPLTGRTHQLRAHMAALGHPIVGDAKYGGPEAFLTGGISRKLHLHARRIRIDSPDGGKLDVSADLPLHFAETLATLGFEQSAGDALPLSHQAPPSPQAKQRKVAAAAKARRRERKGERRSRGSPDKAKRR